MEQDKKQENTNERKVNHGKNIARFRKLRGWTQDQMAERLGHVRKTIVSWESTTELSEDIIQKCAKILEISDYYIKHGSLEDMIAKFSGSEFFNCNFADDDLFNVDRDVLTADHDFILNNPIDSVMKMHEEEVERLTKDINEWKERYNEIEKENTALKKEQTDTQVLQINQLTQELEKLKRS